MQKIKNLLGIKTCEHKWIVSYNSTRYKSRYKIFKFCSCGKNKHLTNLKYDDMPSKILETLKGIKTQNPDYFVIDVD
jgi:hypothetical protein